MDTNTRNAYLAGYIDGDGCLFIGRTLQKPKNVIVYEYYLQILSVKREVLQYFMDEFGGAIRQKAQRPNQKIPYVLTMKNINGINAIRCAQPYLIDKAIAASVYLRFCDLITRNEFKVVPKAIIDERNNLIDLIRKDRHMDGFVTKENIAALQAADRQTIPSQGDYAYLAGLIDAEGCFRIKKWKPKSKPNYVYAISLEIGNTKYAIFPWLKERFGGNVLYVKAKANKKESAIWCLSSRALFDILPMMCLFLRSKKEVCLKLIDFGKTIIPNGGDRHSDKFSKEYQGVIACREFIIEQIHKLNAKGTHISQVPSGCRRPASLGFPVSLEEV